jgi:hypothetical protein
MADGRPLDRNEISPGTLYLLILGTLARFPSGLRLSV